MTNKECEENCRLPLRFPLSIAKGIYVYPARTVCINDILLCGEIIINSSLDFPLTCFLRSIQRPIALASTVWKPFAQNYWETLVLAWTIFHCHAAFIVSCTNNQRGDWCSKLWNSKFQPIRLNITGSLWRLSAVSNHNIYRVKTIAHKHKRHEDEVNNERFTDRVIASNQSNITGDIWSVVVLNLTHSLTHSRFK